MAIIINEEKFVTDNATLLDKKLDSPLVRFIEQSPTFVTYYHVNVAETTSDEGWHDAESILDPKSPFRFQKVENFPLYGIEPIVLQLQDGDAGLDTSYEGDAIIVPTTIKPLQNDFFIINVLDDCFLFRITGIEFDTARQDGFYSVHFKLDSNDSRMRRVIEDLVHDNYVCSLQNIGTENHCIIQKEYKSQLDLIDKLYGEIAQLYLSIFYVERYNVLLGEMGNGYLLYDPFMTEFINHNALFSRKDDLSSVYLEEEFHDPKRKLKYERSIYRLMEKPDCSRVSDFFYTIFKGTSNAETDFSKWADDTVYIVDIPPNLDSAPASVEKYAVLSNKFVTAVKFGYPEKTVFGDILKKHFRQDPLSIYDFTEELRESLISLDGGLDMFFIVPLILYIMKAVVSDFYKHGYDSTGTMNDLANSPQNPEDGE